MNALSFSQPTSAHENRPALRVHECFEVLVERQPAAPAIISDQGVVTFTQLDRRANALAHALIADGIAPEEPVGVLTDRSASLPAAFLAILKAGGAYVPMGADLPAQRLASMAAQSRMRRVIVLEGLEPPEDLLAALTANCEDAAPTIFRPEELLSEGDHVERPNRPGATTDLAAILFTSGSTGQPKGVLLQHDSCVNMACGHIQAQAISPRDRILLSTAPGFILGFRQLCLPLVSGAAFVPVSRDLVDNPRALLTAMSRRRVTVAMFTPSYLHLLEGAVPDTLRCIMTAGERPSPEDARTFARTLEYWNLHGATEVCGTICMLRVDPDSSGPIPSGRPFPNTAVHLLDSDGREVPQGEVGEIYVVGAGMARGYLNQPELTAARFVETRYGRAYRTNDLGRWNKDGNLEALGRADDVVKVSGQAVSLGEIEQSLVRHEAVRYAAAMQHEEKLIAFVESDRTDLELPDWHLFLSKTLPSYMLPASVTVLTRMPVNAYGKVDRQALVTLAISNSSETAGTPPQGAVEQQIAAVWEEILGAGGIMREDNFFALGGTSLVSIAISQRLQSLGYAVAARTILAAPTVAALAERLEAGLQEESVGGVATTEDEATSGQQDFWIAWELGLPAIGSQITRVLSVRGAVPEPERWHSAWREVVKRHPALRTAFFANPDGRLLWRTADSEELNSAVQLRIEDCASLDAASECIAVRSRQPFDLTAAPLARAGLVRAPETFFWFTLHHSVADGLSARIVQEEMHALLLGHPLPPVENGVALATRAERQYLKSDTAERDRAYWRDRLDAAPRDAFDEFATDFRRADRPGAKPAARLVERLDARVVAALRRLAQTEQVGLHALLLTVLAADVRRRDSRSTLIIGSGVSVRPPGAERIVGHFVNLLPLILPIENALPLSAQFRAAQRTLTEAVEHGRYPASLVAREFRERHPDARPTSRTSLFDLALTANPSRTCTDPDTGFSLTPPASHTQSAYPAAGLDLAFSYEAAGDEEGDLELALAWNPDVYRQSTAHNWLSSFAAWVRWLAEDATRVQRPLPALLPEEQRRLARWENGPGRTRPPKRFHELVETIAAADLQHPAVITDAGLRTYAELESQANGIARMLLDNGVSHEEPVAVLTECCADLPATVLGIWKAGAAYLPLALDQPAERLAYMVTDAAPARCLFSTAMKYRSDWRKR